MNNLIEYSDNYSETSGSLWQYYRDEPNATLTDSESFKSKMKIATNTPAEGNTKNVEIAVRSKYLSKFWRTLEMPLINCEINLLLTRSSTCVIANSTSAGTFTITDAKRYVPVVNLSAHDYVKLLQQLKSRFIRTINWNEYQPKISMEKQNPHLDYLIDPRFQGVNRLFVLSFENYDDRKAHTGHYLPKIKIKD